MYAKRFDRKTKFVYKTPYLWYSREFPCPGKHRRLYGQHLNQFQGYHPQRAGIIPYCFKDGHLYYFMTLGSRDELGDFGGGISHKETTVDGALRECLEESAGIFGFQKAHVIDKSFVIYSEEMAVMFVPIPADFIHNLPIVFYQVVSGYRHLLQQTEAELALAGLEQHTRRRLLDQIQVLHSMTEKSQIMVVRHDILTLAPKPIFYAIHTLIERSADLLERNLRRDVVVPFTFTPYEQVAQRSLEAMSQRKKDSVQQKLNLDPSSTWMQQKLNLDPSSTWMQQKLNQDPSGLKVDLNLDPSINWMQQDPSATWTQNQDPGVAWIEQNLLRS